MAQIIDVSGFMFLIFVLLCRFVPFLFVCYLLLSLILIGLFLRASLSCDWAHLIPLLRISLLPPMCMLGNLPFFFMIIVMASNAKLMAIINSVNNKVLNIFITFVCLTETALLPCRLCKYMPFVCSTENLVP